MSLVDIGATTWYTRRPSFPNGNTSEQGKKIDSYEPADHQSCRDPEGNPEGSNSPKDSSIEEEDRNFN